MRSRAGGKTSAQDEPLALRGGVSVCAVYVSGAGRGYQAERSRSDSLRRVHVRVVYIGAVRDRLGDVPGARVVGPGATIVSVPGTFAGKYASPGRLVGSSESVHSSFHRLWNLRARI